MIRNLLWVGGLVCALGLGLAFSTVSLRAQDEGEVSCHEQCSVAEEVCNKACDSEEECEDDCAMDAEGCAENCPQK